MPPGPLWPRRRFVLYPVEAIVTRGRVRGYVVRSPARHACRREYSSQRPSITPSIAGTTARLAPGGSGYRRAMTDTDPGFTIVSADQVDDVYAGSDVPGEFRSLTDALGAEQVAITLIRVPPHSDFEQGTGHTHERIEELYLIARGTLTMRFGDEIRRVGAGSVVRVAPGTVRSHRNEGDETVEIWAVSVKSDRSDAVKVDEFWEASPDARQQLETRG